jgi:three-Cys-motif partner protein
MAEFAFQPFPTVPEPDPHAQRWPGREDDFVVAPDLLPARIVKAHNVHKKFYIESYTGVVAKTMKGKWGSLAYIDTYCGPGVCWVEDTGEFVTGSPLIAMQTEPAFTHFAFVDKDSVCVDALRQRAAALHYDPQIHCGDSNAPDVIDWIRSVTPRQDTLALALLDPQGCTLEPKTIQALTRDRRMDLMINLPVHGLYRNLAANNFKVIERVLGPDYPRCPLSEWRLAVREHYKDLLRNLGYEYSSSREVRSEKNRTPIYDFVLASKHGLGKKLFDGVTKTTVHGQMSMLG